MNKSRFVSRVLITVLTLIGSITTIAQQTQDDAQQTQKGVEAAVEALFSNPVVEEYGEDFLPEELKIQPFKRKIDSVKPDDVCKGIKGLEYLETRPWEEDIDGKRYKGTVKIFRIKNHNQGEDYFGLFIVDDDNFILVPIRVKVDAYTGEESYILKTNKAPIAFKHSNGKFLYLYDTESLYLYSPYQPGGKAPISSPDIFKKIEIHPFSLSYETLYSNLMLGCFDYITKYENEQFSNKQKEFSEITDKIKEQYRAKRESLLNEFRKTQMNSYTQADANRFDRQMQQINEEETRAVNPYNGTKENISSHCKPLEYDWEAYKNAPDSMKLWFYVPEFGPVKPYRRDENGNPSYVFSSRIWAFSPYPKDIKNTEFPYFYDLVHDDSSHDKYSLQRSIKILNNDGRERFFWVNPKINIKSIVKEKNIITIVFNECDTLKYSTYANCPIYLKFKNKDLDILYDKTKNIHHAKTLRELKVEVFDGSSSLGMVPVEPDSKISVGNISSFLSYEPSEVTNQILNRTGSIINSKGVEEFYGGQKLQWIHTEDYYAKLKAKKAAEIRKAELPIYNAYCNKYGKRYVDAVLNEKMVIGMPLALIKEVLHYGKTNDYGSAQWYNVLIVKPKYDLEKKKLVPDNSIFSVRASVLIRNGRVAAINYR